MKPHKAFVDLFYLRELVYSDGLVILDDCNCPSVQARSIVSKWKRDGGRADAIVHPLFAFRLPYPSTESFKWFW